MVDIQRTQTGSPYLSDHSEYIRAVARMIRGAGRRVSGADPADLAELLELRAHLDDAIQTALHGQRERYSLAEIAHGLGVTRQAVHKMLRRA